MSSYGKERKIIHKSLTEQGCRHRSTQDGDLYYLPNGNILALHGSISDRRGLLNARSVVRQAGLTWPLDK